MTERWFVRNVRDVDWTVHPKFGARGSFEDEYGDFKQLGINIRVLDPGQPACLYHRESFQEDFLVLAGECLLLVEGEEQLVKAWDFVHLPANVEHVFVGSGTAPCAVLMVGARGEEGDVFYPSSELAQRHGAAAAEDTNSPRDAYAPFGRREPGKPSSWDAQPWS
jgi:uncharacterized cupin superfamily protein